MICPLCFKRNNISRMVLIACELHGITVAEEILRFTGMLPLISPYRTTLAYPFLYFWKFWRVGMPWRKMNLTKGVGHDVGRLLCGLFSNLIHNFMGNHMQLRPQEGLLMGVIGLHSVV